MRGGFALLLAVAASLAGVPRALADSWDPFPDQRVADPTGRWYVVLQRDGSHSPSVPFRYYEAAERNRPVATVPDAPSKGMYRNLGPFEGDRLLAEGRVPDEPFKVLVSSTGLGFAAVEHYGGLGYETTLATFGQDGRQLQRRFLKDFFTDGEIWRFTQSASSVWWLYHAWIDEGRKEVVLVSRTLDVRVVPFQGGDVRRGGADEALRALEGPFHAPPLVALELAAKHGARGSEHVLREAALSEDLETRWRALAALASLGEEDSRRRLNEEMAGERIAGVGAHLARFLACLARGLFGVEGLALIRRLPADRLIHCQRENHFAVREYLEYGDEAMPLLVTLALDRGEHEDGPSSAAWNALLDVRSPRALRIALEAVGDRDAVRAKRALYLAWNMGRGEIASDLAGWLERGCLPVDGILAYFGEVKHPPVVEILVRRMERLAVSDREGALAKALRFQTGADLDANDPKAWRRWLESRK